MNQGKSIRDQLESAARNQTAQPWHASTSRGVLDVHVRALGSIGLSFDRLTYRAPSLSGVSMSELQKACHQLAQRLAYLLEPIRVLEVDEARGAVQMRSQPPSQQDNCISYFELLARNSGEIQLIRYQKPPQQSREAIPSDVTFEVLERLAGDFDQVASR